MTEHERHEALSDALMLAEQSEAYREGAQWAVVAVIVLRSVVLDAAVKASSEVRN